jgi:uncharacterized membrane protein
MKIFSKQNSTETVKRSIVKTLSYRLTILILDFVTLFLFTNSLKIAVSYTIISNTYTILAYFFHERIWNNILWGRIINK